MSISEMLSCGITVDITDDAIEAINQALGVVLNLIKKRLICLK